MLVREWEVEWDLVHVLEAAEALHTANEPIQVVCLDRSMREQLPLLLVGETFTLFDNSFSADY